MRPVNLALWRPALAIVLLMTFTVFLLATNAIARNTGKEIILQVEPIDPRDMFFGHYSIISYTGEAADPPERWKIAADEDNSGGGQVGYSPPSGAGAVMSFAGNMVRVLSYEDTRPAELPEDAVFVPITSPLHRWQRPTSFLQLPDRYYADQDTAQALDRYLAGIRRDENERRRALMDEETAAAEAQGRTPDFEAVNAQLAGEQPLNFAILAYHSPDKIRLKGLIVGDREYRDNLWGGQGDELSRYLQAQKPPAAPAL
jgi:hypothetical protein